MPCPPGFNPVMMLAKATGVCGGVLVCRGTNEPCCARALKCGIFPASMYCRRSSGSMPSTAITTTFVAEAGAVSRPCAKMASASATAPAIDANPQSATERRGYFLRRNIIPRSSITKRTGRASAAELLFAGWRPQAPDAIKIVAKRSMRSGTVIRGLLFCAAISVGVMAGAPASLAAQDQAANTAADLKAAQDELDRGDYAAAARDFESVRAKAPDIKDAWQGLVLSLQRGGKSDDALRAATDAAARWPNDGELRHLLGFVYFQNGRPQEAVKELTKATQLEPARYQAHLDLALAQMSLKDFGGAAKQLEAVTRLQPKLAMPHVLLGRALLNTNRTLPAIQEFQQALQLEPQIPLGHYHLGFAYQSLGRNAEAIAEFRREDALHPGNPQVLYRLGLALVDTGQYEEAARFLGEAVRTDANNGDAQYTLGKCLLQLDHTDEAIEALTKASALLPEDPRAFYLLARAYAKTQKPQESAKALDRFNELSKKQQTAGGMAYRPN